MNEIDIKILKVLNNIEKIKRWNITISITTISNLSSQYLLSNDFDINNLIFTYLCLFIITYLIINRGEKVTIFGDKNFRLVKGGPGYKILKHKYTEEIITEIPNTKIYDMFLSPDNYVKESLKNYINYKTIKYDR